MVNGVRWYHLDSFSRFSCLNSTVYPAWMSRNFAQGGKYHYLWYTLANSLIGFWNRLNPTFTMAAHFFNHCTSTNGTTNPPKTGTEIWSMSGANCKIIDIFWRLEDAGSRQNKINFSFWISASNLKCLFLQLRKGTTWDMQRRSSR